MKKTKVFLFSIAALLISMDASAACVAKFMQASSPGNASRFFLCDLAADTATGAADGDERYNKNDDTLQTYDGATWNTVGAGGGGAPTNATYITQTANGSLSNEQPLGALTTGVLKSTTVTGVVSIAVAGTDFAAPTSGSTVLLGNGAGGFSNYAGTSCTNQFARSLSTAGAATCNSVASADITDGTVAYADIQNVGALSVFGRSANSIGVGADIGAGSDDQILRRSASVLGFGSINLAASSAVGTSILSGTNGGTGMDIGLVASNRVFMTQGTSTAAMVAVPACTDSAGQHLNYTSGSPGSFSCGTTSSGGGNLGTFTVSFGSGALSVYDSAETVVSAAWVASGSSILLTPKCVATVGGNTIDNCLVTKLQCSVSTITASTSFGVICHAPITASGSYTISYTGG